LKWYRKAAERGEGQSQYRVGEAYQHGIGVGKDLEQAIDWFQRAAEQTNSSAAVKLARIHENSSTPGKESSEALKWYRKAAQNGDPQGQADAIRLLISEGKLETAEELLNEVISRTNALGASHVQLLSTRADVLAARGRAKEAIADLRKVAELDSSGDTIFFRLVAMLIATGDVAGYRQVCEEFAKRFGDTTDADQAEHIVIGLLFVPPAGLDLALMKKMGDLALTKKHYTGPALAEYRLGNFQDAAKWAKAAQAKWSNRPNHNGLFSGISALAAMTQFQTGQIDQARTNLNKAIEIGGEKFAELESGKFGDQWWDWIFARTLVKEAAGLLGESVVARNAETTAQKSASSSE
jgi:TPR repeat protein